MSRRNQTILLLLGNANIGGTEKQVVHFAKELHERDYQVEVWTLACSGPLFEFAKSMNVELISLGLKSTNPVKILPNFYKFCFRIFKTKPQFSLFFLPDCIIIGNFAFRLISKRTIRISCIRGRMRRKNLFLDYALKNSLKNSNYYLCNSKHLKEKLILDYSIKDTLIRVIHNGSNLNPFPVDVAKQPPKALFLSNFHDYKGHFDLLRALIGIDCNLKIVLLGEGPLKKDLDSFVVANKLSSIVEFISPGFLVEQLVADFQFAIHPSHTEGFSNAILEEISAGLPIIASNVGGNPELVINNFNGFLISPGDVLELRKSIITLATDADMRIRMSKNSRIQAQLFTWDKCVNSHLEYFHHIQRTEG